jgi:hypothetical protein
MNVAFIPSTLWKWHIAWDSDEIHAATSVTWFTSRTRSNEHSYVPVNSILVDFFLPSGPSCNFALLFNYY